MFKKQQQNDGRRARQPVIADKTGSQGVFSYHANRSAARTDKATFRNAGALSWAGGGTPSKPSPRPPAPGRFRRARIIVVLAVLVGLCGYSLILNRNPEVIALADTGGRRLFLQKPEVYSRAAQTALTSSLANTNKLTIDTERIAQQMREQFPELEHVSVVLPVFGRRPIVYVQPAHPAVLLKTSDGGVFVLDGSGRALISASQVPKVDKLGLAVVEDQSGLPAVLGRPALPGSNVAFITEVVGQLKAKQLTPVSMVLPVGATQLDVRVDGVPYIIKFNLHGNAREEVGTYLATKKHLEHEQKTPNNYIDVRVENRAYYR